MTTQQKLYGAITQWDRRQSAKRYHNPHALGIYFQRLETVMALVGRGATWREAVCCGFCDRLLTWLLKSIGEADFTAAERLEYERKWGREMDKIDCEQNEHNT